MKKVPLKPTKKETELTWVYACVCCLVWIALVVASVHLVIYYAYHLFTYGIFHEEGMRIGIYIIGGAFLFLFIYRDEVRRIFRVKNVERGGKAK